MRDRSHVERSPDVVAKRSELMTIMIRSNNAPTDLDDHSTRHQKENRTRPLHLVEIAAYPPPEGSWSLRIDYVMRRWMDEGNDGTLINIGSSRRLKNPKYYNVRGLVHFIFKVTCEAARQSILHTHTNAKGIKGTALALCAQLVSIPFGRRSVLTFHAGLKQQYFPPTGKRWLDILMRMTFKTPRYIICNSDDVKRCIVDEYGIAPEKIFSIPAFCTDYMNVPLAEVPKSVQAFAENHKTLLVAYVFSYDSEFAVDTMLHAVHLLRQDGLDVGLVIVGSSDGADEFERMIDELEMQEHVMISGSLPRSEFLSVLHRADVYLRTPMGDGVASSVLESLTLGTPVVASENGTRPSSCVTYIDRDVQGMVLKLKQVIENRTEFAERITTPKAVDTVRDEIDVLRSLQSTALKPTSKQSLEIQ